MSTAAASAPEQSPQTPQEAQASAEVAKKTLPKRRKRQPPVDMSVGEKARLYQNNPDMLRHKRRDILPITADEVPRMMRSFTHRLRHRWRNVGEPVERHDDDESDQQAQESRDELPPHDHVAAADAHEARQAEAVVLEQAEEGGMRGLQLRPPKRLQRAERKRLSEFFARVEKYADDLGDMSALLRPISVAVFVGRVACFERVQEEKVWRFYRILAGKGVHWDAQCYAHVLTTLIANGYNKLWMPFTVRQDMKDRGVAPDATFYRQLVVAYLDKASIVDAQSTLDQLLAQDASPDEDDATRGERMAAVLGVARALQKGGQHEHVLSLVAQLSRCDPAAAAAIEHPEDAPDASSAPHHTDDSHTSGTGVSRAPRFAHVAAELRRLVKLSKSRVLP